MKSGIYSITNIINNKKYIGYATNIIKRINYHKRQLITNTHSNEHLQNAFNKYGLDNFRFDIIELTLDLNLLPSLENYWCILYNTHDYNFGYNIKPTGDTAYVSMAQSTKNKISQIKTGIKRPKETCENISKGKKGKPNGQKGTKRHFSTEGAYNKIKKHMKKVELYDLKGKPLMVFNSIVETAKFLKTPASHVSNGLRQITPAVKNHQVKYEGESRIIGEVKYKTNIYKNIKCTNIITNEIVIFDNIEDCAVKLNLTYALVSNSIRIKTKKVNKQYKFEYT